MKIKKKAKRLLELISNNCDVASKILKVKEKEQEQYQVQVRKDRTD